MKLVNLLLIIIILFIVSPKVSIFNPDSWINLTLIGVSLFSETLLLQLLLRKYSFNQKVLQFLWVFVTCFTFCLFFVSDFFYVTFSLPIGNVPLIIFFEVLVCLIEALFLFYILKLKIVSRFQTKNISLSKCMIISLIINSFSTLFSFFISPILIKWILLLSLN